jgi:arylformamidase
MHANAIIPPKEWRNCLKVVDLTHMIHPDISMYPGTGKPVLSPLADINSDGFVEHRLDITSHTGTHVDAPAHILAGGLTLDEMTADRFLGPGWVCDISHRNGTEIRRSDLDLPSGVEFLLLYSGWDKKWESEAYFDRYPFLGSDAAKWLTGMKLKGVGFDAISADPHDSTGYPVHNILLSSSMIIIENLTNLDLLLKKHCLFSCLPLRWLHSDGSPVRAVAITDIERLRS